jgi:hypothetical protein
MVDPQSLYVQLGRLVEEMPNLLEPLPHPARTLEWLGRAGALLDASGDIVDATEFHSLVVSLSNFATQLWAAQGIGVAIRRALYKAELKAPAAARGAFVPAGGAFDALSAIGKVLGTAKRDLLIVDPYLDEKVLTDFAALAPENVMIRLLAV